MAGRNKRRGGAAHRLVPGRLVLLVALAMGMGLAYLWLRGRCEQTGREITRLEQRREELRRRAEVEDFKWAAMLAPRHVEEALARQGLEMKWPSRGQVVWLYDSDPDAFLLGSVRDALRHAAERERIVYRD